MKHETCEYVNGFYRFPAVLSSPALELTKLDICIAHECGLGNRYGPQSNIAEFGLLLFKEALLS